MLALHGDGFSLREAERRKSGHERIEVLPALRLLQRTDEDVLLVSYTYAGERLLSTTVQLALDGPVYRVKYHKPNAAGAATSKNALTLLIDPTDQMHRLQRIDAGVLVDGRFDILVIG